MNHSRNSKNSKNLNSFITGALILTLAGMLSRVMGFFYRIFLSRTIGEEGMGLYQLSFSIMMLALSLCAMGFQTAISRYTASAKEEHKTRYFLAGLVLSLGIAIPISILIYFFSYEIACYFLMQPKCESLLQLIAFSIPFSAIHSCLCGYYLGQQKSSIPALAQLIEKFTQVASVFIIWKLLNFKGESITAFHAVIGTLISEIANVIFMIIIWLTTRKRHNKIRKNPITNSSFTFLTCIKQILSMSVPLTVTRLVMSFLQSLEHTMIPNQLCLWGMESSEALSMFGVLTGMAMPFIIFPSSISSSVALMLLPSIASAQSQKDNNHILHTSSLNIQFCLWLGIFSCGVFLLYGNTIGETIFASTLAGHFLKTLSWLCPVFYVVPTMASILNGLGEVKTVFFHNLFSIVIQLLCIFLLMPSFGMTGYFIGLLLSQVFTFVCHFMALHKTIGITFHSWHFFGDPSLLTVITGLIGKGVFLLFQNQFNAHPMVCLFIGIGTMGLLFLWPAMTFFISNAKQKQ